MTPGDAFTRTSPGAFYSTESASGPGTEVTSQVRRRMSLNWEAAERLRGDQVEDQIEFGRLLDRDADRLRPAQKLVDNIGGALEHVPASLLLRQRFRKPDNAPRTMFTSWSV